MRNNQVNTNTYDNLKGFLTILLLFANGYALQSYLDYTEASEIQQYLLTPSIITTLAIIIWLLSKRHSEYKKMISKLTITLVLFLIIWTVIILYSTALAGAYQH